MTSALTLYKVYDKYQIKYVYFSSEKFVRYRYFLPMRGLRIKGAWAAGRLGKGVIYFFKALRKGLEIHQGNTVSFLA